MNDNTEDERNQDFNVYESDENYEIEPTEQPHEKVSSVLTSLTVIRDELKDSATIPFWLISKCFTFEKVDNHLILKNINVDYWNAVRLYTLLLYKYRELGEKRMHVSIRFMTKGLGIHYTQLINALDILRKGKFIKTRKEGQKLHAIKHYVSMLKVT